MPFFYTVSILLADTVTPVTEIETQQALLQELQELSASIVDYTAVLEQIYTVLVYIFAILIIYGVGKLLSSLFVT